MKNNIIVIGFDHVNTIGLIRSIGELGIKPIYICLSTNRRSWVSKSKYINKTYFIEKKIENIIELLNNISSEKKNNIYVFPSSDFFVKNIDIIKEKISKNVILPSINNLDYSFNFLLDKNNMINIANQVGFDIPKTYYFNSNQNGIDDVKNYFQKSYPVFVRFKNIFKKITNENELIQFLFKHNNEEILIQEFIDKDEELGIMGVSKNNIIIPGIIHKIRTSLKSPGSTTFGIIKKSNNDNLINHCIKFINQIGYKGIFDIEVMVKNSKYYFIECNFRNGAYGYSYSKFGYNLPAIFLDINNTKNINQDDLYLINEFSDIKYFFSKKINAFIWLKQLINSNIYLTWNNNDKKPFIYRLIYGAK